MKIKLLIIGSGPAGCSAAIYAARANLEPVMVCGEQPGGQLTITTDVENYPGFPHIVQGPELMQSMEQQAKNVGTRVIYDTIERVDFSSAPFRCYSANQEYIADSVIIATGASAKWLGIESESHYRGFGISGCATCDAFFFKGKDVAVVGGGNSAIEEALYLTKYANKVYLVHRRSELRGEKILQERLLKNEKIVPLWNKAVHEIVGQDEPFKHVNKLRLKDVDNGNISEIDVEGVFIAIGHKPNTGIFKSALKLDSDGYIEVTNSVKTSVDGVFAAGDVADKIYRQAVTAAGMGCMAALDVARFLES